MAFLLKPIGDMGLYIRCIIGIFYLLDLEVEEVLDGMLRSRSERSDLLRTGDSLIGRMTIVSYLSKSLMIEAEKA